MIERGNVLVLVSLTAEAGPARLKDAFGAYIGGHTVLEIPQGISTRDYLAELEAKVLALEASLEALGYEVHYPNDVESLRRDYEAQTLTVNGEPWDLEGAP